MGRYCLNVLTYVVYELFSPAKIKGILLRGRTHVPDSEN